MAEATIESIKLLNQMQYILKFEILLNQEELMTLDFELLKECGTLLEKDATLSYKFNVLERLFKALGK